MTHATSKAFSSDCIVMTDATHDKMERNKKISTLRGTDLVRPITNDDYVRYVSREGVIVDDDIETEDSFLDRYIFYENGRLVYNKSFEKEVSSFRAFMARNVVEGRIFSSFFTYSLSRILCYLTPSLYGEEISLEVEEEEVRPFYDPLGFYGGNCKRIDVAKLNEDYFLGVCEQFTLLERIRVYRNWLRMVSDPISVGHDTFDTPYGFVETFERQFGLYYETMKLFVKRNPGKKVRIFSDGLGAMSMICIALGISYVSNEPFGIGAVACSLGIISTSSSFFCPVEGEVNILCNLSSYYNMKRFIVGEYVVVDENRFFFGCYPEDICKTSQYKVHSNVIDDEFIGAGTIISKAYTMIETKKNIPLDSKAEAYLHSRGLPAYLPDRKVEDPYKCVVLKPTLKGNYFISSRNYVSSFPYLNIVTREYPLSKKMHPGSYRVLNGVGVHPIVGFNQIYNNLNYEEIVMEPLVSVGELTNFTIEGSLLYGICKNPRVIRYYVNFNKERIKIRYLMSRPRKKHGEVHIFCHAEFVGIAHDIVDFE